MKKFKERKLGKIIWGIGDALKGKGKGAKYADALFEVIPLPNPIRVARDRKVAELLEFVKNDKRTFNAVNKFNPELLDRLLDQQPNCVKTALLYVTLIGLFVLVGLGVVDVEFLAEFISTIL